LKENEMPQKNEIVSMSLMDSFINQLYYYGSINVEEEDSDDDNVKEGEEGEEEEEEEEEIELKENKKKEMKKGEIEGEEQMEELNKEDKDEKEKENNSVVDNENKKEKYEKRKEEQKEQDERNQPPSHDNMDIYKDDNNQTIKNEERKDLDDQEKINKSKSRYRPSWWKEVIFSVFEDKRSQLWNKYKIKNCMTKEEFIVWILKFGKIVKDEELWQAFIIWFEKNEKSEEIENKNDHERENRKSTDHFSLSDKQKLKLENKDYTEEIKIFLHEVLFIENNQSENSTKTPITPIPIIQTLFFHEKEWNQILKLIL